MHWSAQLLQLRELPLQLGVGVKEKLKPINKRQHASLKAARYAAFQKEAFIRRSRGTGPREMHSAGLKAPFVPLFTSVGLEAPHSTERHPLAEQHFADLKAQRELIVKRVLGCRCALFCSWECGVKVQHPNHGPRPEKSSSTLPAYPSLCISILLQKVLLGKRERHSATPLAMESP